MNSTVPKTADFPKARCRKEIKIGEIVPGSVTIWCDGGTSIGMNLGSGWFDMLFKRELAKLQKEEYEFSDICRNENELQAFYAAIKFNTKEHGYDVDFFD